MSDTPSSATSADGRKPEPGAGLPIAASQEWLQAANEFWATRWWSENDWDPMAMLTLIDHQIDEAAVRAVKERELTQECDQLSYELGELESQLETIVRQEAELHTRRMAEIAWTRVGAQRDALEHGLRRILRMPTIGDVRASASDALSKAQDLAEAAPVDHGQLSYKFGELTNKPAQLIAQQEAELYRLRGAVEAQKRAEDDHQMMESTLRTVLELEKLDHVHKTARRALEEAGFLDI